MNDKVSLLLHKRWTGQISPEELSQLEALLSSDPGLRKEAAEMESIWAKATPLATPGFVPNPDKEWVRFKKDNLGGGAKVVSKPPRILALIPFAFVGKAAAAVAFLVMSYFIVQNIQPDSQDSYAGYEKISPHPEKVMGGLKLDDGSVVWINSNTTFWYPKSFNGNERRVILEGEAHFLVQKDPSKPFIVQTPKGEVRVLGTAFNVKAFRNARYEEVFVESGTVVLKPQKGDKELKLERGNAARLKKSTLRFVGPPALPAQVLQWKIEALNFRNTPLKDILKALEDNTPMRFNKDGIEDILECPFTISLQGADEKKVLKYLKEVTGVEVRLGAESYYYLSGGRKCR